ncbi:hypothetical protein C8R46DRAFT_890768 [Mycena filopes]|nr:hypothetical protein C8R46DRAFT_890768 [Mycena filopes]
MDNAPPAKRRRTETEDEAPLVRSAEYWFDDGNIILQVEFTQFRLLKSQLSMHSSVFRDMFTVPLPADEPTIEGCPVVVLSGDTAQDWAVLLAEMYPSRLAYSTVCAIDLAAILRLSKKYDLSLFREDCLNRLKTEFPTTLREYIDLDHLPFQPDHALVYFTVISLAKEIGLHSILPLAYYFLWENEKNRSKILDPNDVDLSPSDRLACLLGYTNLLKLQWSTTIAWLDLDKHHVPIPSCRQSSKCIGAVKDRIVKISETPPPQLWLLDDWDDDWVEGLCQPCRKKAKEIHKAGRETCWAQLPGAFGLPDWETLKSLDLP